MEENELVEVDPNSILEGSVPMDVYSMNDMGVVETFLYSGGVVSTYHRKVLDKADQRFSQTC